MWDGDGPRKDTEGDSAQTVTGFLGMSLHFRRKCGFEVKEHKKGGLKQWVFIKIRGDTNSG